MSEANTGEDVMEHLEDNLCLICHKPKDNHNFRHPFADGRDGRPESLFARTDGNDESSNHKGEGDPVALGRVRMPLNSDPVLRMALIRAGVIKTQDLDAVEEELRVTGVAGYEPVSTTLG